MRPAFASTSDPSGSRRATNRVTARDPRPKNPGSLPFLPSFLTLFRPAIPPFSPPLPLPPYLSPFRAIPPALAFTASSLRSPRLLASFFALWPADITAAVSGLNPSLARAGGTEGREKEGKRGKRANHLQRPRSRVKRVVSSLGATSTRAAPTSAAITFRENLPAPPSRINPSTLRRVSRSFRSGDRGMSTRTIIAHRIRARAEIKDKLSKWI